MLPKAMHLTGTHIENGCASNQAKCPLALMLNDHLEDGWLAFSEVGRTYLVPNEDHIAYLDKDSESIEDSDEYVDEIGGIILRHEDRIIDWIMYYDKHNDMFTCHVFPDDTENPTFLSMNRTGRDEWLKDRAERSN